MAGGVLLARERWGCGIATEALRQFVAIMPMRPLHAPAVRDNIGSMRVLEKFGFVAVGEERTVSMIRVEEVDAAMFVLER